jgi:hypothetical protein
MAGSMPVFWQVQPATREHFMTDFMLAVPDDVLSAARLLAEATSQSVEEVLIHRLKTALPVPVLPPDEEAELEALNHLSDDALWTMTGEQLPHEPQARMSALMERNSRGTITPDEYAELEKLVERGQRLMLRKAEAASILRQRGYTVTSKDMARRDE